MTTNVSENLYVRMEKRVSAMERSHKEMGDILRTLRQSLQNNEPPASHDGRFPYVAYVTMQTDRRSGRHFWMSIVLLPGWPLHVRISEGMYGALLASGIPEWKEGDPPNGA